MYKKTLRKLLVNDGVSGANTEIILGWATKYQPLSIKGRLSKKAFDSIIAKNPDRLISYISKGNVRNGNLFTEETAEFFIALIRNSDPSRVSYGICYVS